MFVAGLLSILMCLLWPRDENGDPKRGRAILVLGLLLGFAAVGPGWALQRQQERVELEQGQQREESNLELEANLRNTEVRLERATIELESLRNSASLERRIDAEREAADHKALTDMASKMVPAGDVLKLYFDESRSGLTFATGKKDLTCDAKEKLARIAIYLREERNLAKITIVGHTDSTQRAGDQSFNQRLSEARANEVVQYLQNAGVQKELLTWRGEADRQPAGFDKDQPQKTIDENNSTEHQKALNRRVEIDIQQKPKS
jgi:outer membrane protein OmpA-like peptidoglycan-associated protein